MSDISAAVGSFLAQYGLIAIVAVMLIKELGVPLPVPSDLIMITAGVQAAAGSFTLPALLVAIEAAIIVGGSAQFLLARGVGRQAIYRLGRLVGLTPERLDRAMAALQRRGAMAVFVGLNVPGARAGVIPAAGLTGLRYAAFVAAMIAGSTLFYGWHIALGYLVGPSAAGLLERLDLPLLPIVGGLAVLGLAGWLLLRVRRRRSDPGTSALDHIHAWTEAACPVCLVAGALAGARAGLPEDERPAGQGFAGVGREPMRPEDSGPGKTVKDRRAV